MKKLTRRQALLLSFAGMFVLAASQIFSHYVALPDLAKGMLTGFSIGLLMTAMIFGNLKATE